jgi:aldose 1-epimerase
MFHFRCGLFSLIAVAGCVLAGIPGCKPPEENGGGGGNVTEANGKPGGGNSPTSLKSIPSTDEGKMTVTKKEWGTMPDGTPVELYTLSNQAGIEVDVTTFGAMLTRVAVPDRDGNAENVTLCLESLEDYRAGHPYFGCVVGRYANRIADGRFSLDGKEYKLATNNGKNHLHGGNEGFDKKVWQAEPIESDEAVGVRLTYTSPDGEEGYPGELSATVRYELTAENELVMDYTAVTDAPTVVNLTNHAYWNLGGADSGSVLDQQLVIEADEFLPVDDTLIPLGTPMAVAGTAMDFRQGETIGARIDQVEGGYDHCYLLNKTADGEMSLAARLGDPESGRVMEVYTTQPAMQLYSGNFLDGSLSAHGNTYNKHGAVCLETQHFPDSPNQPSFPSTVLRPGEKYHQRTVHKFFVSEP